MIPGKDVRAEAPPPSGAAQRRRWGVPALLLVLAFLVVPFVAAAPAAAFPAYPAYDLQLAAVGHGAVALVDLTADGRSDILTVDDEFGDVYAYVQVPSQGIHGPLETSFTVPATAHLLAREVTGGGPLDLVVAHEAGLTVHRGHGSGFDAEPVFAAEATDLRAVDVGDLDGNGLPDLAVLTAADLRVWFQGMTGFLRDPVVVVDPGFDDLVVADVTGDGRQEVLMSRSGELRRYAVEIAEGVETVWKATHPVAGIGGTTALLAAPTAGSAATVIVVEATAEEGWVTLARWGTTGLVAVAAFGGSYVTEAALGDLNDDGQVDLLTLTRTGEIEVRFLDPTRGAAPTADLVLPGKPLVGGERLAAGDLNGDGYDDVLLRTVDVPALRIYLQEDLPVVLARALPSPVIVQEGRGLQVVLDARDFLRDDHGVLQVGVASVEPADRVRVAIEGTRLSVEPEQGWYGKVRIALWGWDGVADHPKVVTNAFDVLVNDAPAVVSNPPTRLTGGEELRYQVRVADAFPLGDRHTFELVAAPAGMTLDPATGVLRWTPPVDTEGTFAVALRVRDGHGGVSAVQAFRLAVSSPVPLGLSLVVLGLSLTLGTLAAAALLANENLKWALLLFFLPLYSKIKREKVLDHFLRGQIYGYIVANPGEHYNGIKAALDLTNGSLAHHLKTLERENFIKSKRFGLYRRFYPYDYRIPEEDAFRLTEVQQGIVDLLRRRPGLSQREVGDAIGVTPPTVNYHVSILADRGILRVVRKGRRTRCYVRDDDA